MRIIALCSAWIGIAAGVAAFRECPAAPGGESDPCTRPSIGSEVAEPEDLRSRDGVLRLQLTVRNHRESDGSMRYCYVLGNGAQAPTLRLKPGDTLVLRLENELGDLAASPATAHSHRPARGEAAGRDDPCSRAAMSSISTNLHFHGLTIPPVCHQDDVLKTKIQPGDAPFEYRFQIPVDQPPGLYWYHPHIHGFSTQQVLGGASGALIVEGIERAEPLAAGLPERVLVIRDQDLANPGAPPSKSEPVVPKMFIDRDGDAANNGTGFGRPAKDLSINYVPVPYPDYPPARLSIRPGERQLWRVVNASAITYLNLALIFRRSPQPLGLVALDGVPLSTNGNAANAVEWRDHVGLAPGARAEFIVNGPPAGVPALLVTRSVDTGQGGENDPNRALASVVARADAAEPRSVLPAAAEASGAAEPAAEPARPWLGSVAPIRVRRLYFSEKLSNPADPNSATEFYLTVDGETPKPFDPAATEPDIVVRQGDVEDWIIENRSTELHAFHIHQLHFLLLDWSGTPVQEPFLRDTINVPYYNATMLQYPSVRLRMDFRDPNIVGTFVYHCHLLEHEDAGMMGTIRVLPRE
jgi:FtsP/CotA-like multicopper oxidase with cupredoxin domain